jgi:hypothetical protein
MFARPILQEISVVFQKFGQAEQNEGEASRIIFSLVVFKRLQSGCRGNLAYNYQLAAEHKSLLLLRERAALLLRIAPEYVLPSLVARCFFVDVVTKRQVLQIRIVCDVSPWPTFRSILMPSYPGW